MPTPCLSAIFRSARVAACRTRLLFTVLTAIAITCSVARADTIVTFQLNHVVLDDSSTASGTFTVNETTNSISDWSISYSGGGTSGAPSHTFSTGVNWWNSATYTANAGYVAYVRFDDLVSFSTNEEFMFFLTFQNPLADVADSVLIGPQQTCAFCGANSQIAYIYPSGSPSYSTWANVVGTSNPSVSPVEAPEPASLAILGGAIGFAAIARRSRQRDTVRAQLA